ncbi:MAG: FmdB family zinc ribbon protein [Rhodoferax sp.]
MPIYAYKCESCGYRKDALQKISDAPLTVCPHCGAPAFKKQITAASFRLKGGGWYATDFRSHGTEGASENHTTPTNGHHVEGQTDGKTSEDAPTQKSEPATAKPEAAPVKSNTVPAAAASPHH